MPKVEDRPPTYCQIEDIEQVIDIPTPGDPNGSTMIFTDETHPSRKYVEKLILSAEDEIDRRCHTSWRTNYVKDAILDIRSYQADENGYRQEYYLNGGNVVNLHKNVCTWNPDPIYEFYRDEDGQMILVPLTGKVRAPSYSTHDPITPPPTPVEKKRECERLYLTDDDDPLYVQERSGEIIYDDETGDPKLEYAIVYVKKEGEEAIKTDERRYVPLRDGELQWVLDSEGNQIVKLVQPLAPKPKKMIYGGDKLYIRRPMFYIPSLNNPQDGNDIWVDVSRNENMNTFNSTPNAWFWFDYKSGRLFIRSYFLGTRQNALKITYRWGSEEPVPMQISRACALTVAIQILNGSAFALKFGIGGDMANVREGIVRNWEMEIGRALSSYQRAGTVHSWSR